MYKIKATSNSLFRLNRLSIGPKSRLNTVILSCFFGATFTLLEDGASVFRYELDPSVRGDKGL